MAKALIGYMNSDLRIARSESSAENTRLRARVAELEALVLRLRRRTTHWPPPRRPPCSTSTPDHAGDAARLSGSA